MKIARRLVSLLLCIVLLLSVLPSVVPSVAASETTLWPQLTSFNVNEIKGGAVNDLGLAQKQFAVTGIEIIHNDTLEIVDDKNIAGKVVVSVGEDFSQRKAMQVVKDTWSATVSDGATLVTATNKAITMQSKNDFVSPAALELSYGTNTVYYDVTVVYKAPWPQLTSFSVNEIKGGAVNDLGLAQKQFAVTGIEIIHNDTLEIVDDKNIAGKVVVSVGEDFSQRKAMQVVKDTWSATVSDGATLVTATNKAITMQSKNDFVSPAALELSYGTNTVYYDVVVVSTVDSTVDSTPPVLSVVADSINRTSETEASLKFHASEAGKYFFAVADTTAEAPSVDVSGEGIAMIAGENSISLSELTADAKKVSIMAKDQDGNVTTKALVVEIPAYVPPTYSLSLYAGMSITAPKLKNATVNGVPTDFVNGNTINGIAAGDTVCVWMDIPAVDGVYYDLDTVSLMTNDGEKNPVMPVTVNADNSFSFTMPSANVRSAVGSWYTTKPSTQTWYSLTATTSLLWPHQDDRETNRKGTVTFTDQNGDAITRAREGDVVTAVATPRDGGQWYVFEFVEWNVKTGITIDDQQKHSSSITFTMPSNDVALHAEFENIGTEISWSVVPADSNIKIGVFGNYVYNPYTYNTGAVGHANYYDKSWFNEYQFIGWTVKVDGVDKTDDSSIVRITPSGDDPTALGYWQTAEFTATGQKMEFIASFYQRKFAAVTVSANNSSMGSATVTVDDSTAASLPVVFENQTVTLTAAPGDRYKLDSWTVTDADGATIPVTPDAEDPNKATFIMPGTGKNITAVANFVVDPEKASSECLLTAVTLYDAAGNAQIATGSKKGTAFTITLPAGTDASELSEMVLKLTVSEYATVKKSGDAENWPEDGKACGMAPDNPFTFTVTAEDGTTSQEYTVTIVETKSSDKDITAVHLLDKNKDVLAAGNLNGTTWTLELPEDTSADVIKDLGTSADYYLKITHTGASVAMDGGWDDAGGSPLYSAGEVMCAISANRSATFTVKAEDATTKEYTIEITYTAPDAPTLSGGSAERTSDTAATVKFTTNEAGKYYYKVVNEGAAAPTVSTTGGGANAVEGENTISLTNLTAGARDVYIVVKNAYGVDSAAYKVNIPAFSSGEGGESSGGEAEGRFSITVSCPSGGTLVPSKTKANAGDVITVTVQPNSGMQMVAGSLSYTLAIAGGETKKIENYSFTMPAGDVSLTCRWETATVITNGITSFSIMGVQGVVNNTTNTISIVMPYGTDVTQLIPTVSGNNIQNITPTAGKVLDFSKPVTYTVTLTDGTVVRYTVTVYVQEGTAADKMWDSLTDFYDQTPWWEYAEHQQSYGKYPTYW